MRDGLAGKQLILDASPSHEQLWPLSDGNCRGAVDRLVDVFSATFPLVGYDVLWASDTFNGQAFLDEYLARRVRLYGGLVRHRLITSSGILFVLAHETGHHLSGGERHPNYPWLSSESRATAWALSCCPVALGPSQDYQRLIRAGRRELRVAHERVRSFRVN